METNVEENQLLRKKTFVQLENLSRLQTFNVVSLCDADDEVDVGVVVVVRAALHLAHVVGHLDVLGVGFQVLGSDHDDELDGALLQKGLVRPTTDRSNAFHR